MPKHARTDESTEQFFEDEYPDAVESLEPDVSEPSLFGSQEFQTTEMVVAEQGEERGRHGSAGEKPELSAQQRKSRRMRRLLIAVVVLLIVLIGALGYFTWTLFQESQNLAIQQAQRQSDQEADALGSDAQDASTATTKTTEVPNLAKLMGMTEEETIAALKRGATVSSERQVDETGNPVKRSLTVALTDEPADSRLGTPTVYLGLNEDGTVVMTGYSAAMSALGYGSKSFAAAVQDDGIVERTLGEAGIEVAEGTVALPEDKKEYSTYASDGKTLVQEKCSFAGTVEIDGTEYRWSAVLLYDYKLANASGNLADTIRQIYIYLETPGAEAEEPESADTAA